MHKEHGPVIQEFGITTWLLQNKLNFFVETFLIVHLRYSEPLTESMNFFSIEFTINMNLNFK